MYAVATNAISASNNIREGNGKYDACMDAFSPRQGAVGFCSMDQLVDST